MNYIKESRWSDEIAIPESVAVCPDCGTKLTISPDAWTETGGEAFICDSFTTTCEHYDDDEFPHPSYDMPYVYWLPIDTKIEKWLLNNYRFVEA